MYIIIIIIIIILFFVIRLVQRLYYLIKGHKFYWSYFPRKELDLFIKTNGIAVTEHSFRSKKDNVSLKYRRLGNGPKVILLMNGVGTDFFMWLPFLQFMLKLVPNLFTNITLIVPSYRGLFEYDEKEMHKKIEITIDNCVSDIKDVMAHAKVKKYHTIIGWSTGAQVALSCCSKYPDTTDNLILLNPSTGLTLHTVLQPIIPFPAFIGKGVSLVVRSGISFLKGLINTSVWDFLKVVAYSTGFRIFLECLSFFGGFPPEQPTYFHEYMRDVFKFRCQTFALFDLIISLDAILPKEILELSHYSLILSGYPDFITGVYHSQLLEKKLRNSKHVSFTMGSHFLLLEWPEIVAEEILQVINR